MKKYISFFAIAMLVVSCVNDQQTVTEQTDSALIDSVETEVDFYNYHNQFSMDQMDTLLTNLATYIYTKPVAAQWNTKFETRFRFFYVEKRTNFELVYLNQNTDSSFYFYLLRDAQFAKNGYAKRGVLGKFNMDSATLKLSNFEEIVNTPADSDANLKGIGKLLMDELIASCNVDKYLTDKTKVEWPDGTLFYSKEKFEWRSVE